MQLCELCGGRGLVFCSRQFAFNIEYIQCTDEYTFCSKDKKTIMGYFVISHKLILKVGSLY